MKKINVHYILIFVLLALSIVFFKSILNREAILYNIHYINDLTFLSYNTKEAISNNEFPWWTPYFYMGQPLIAIPESYMIDLNLLFIYLFRDIFLAMNLSVILYFFIAGLGMYMLVYTVTQEKNAAFISAVLFMFNGFMQSFVLHGHINILEGYSLIPFIFLLGYNAMKGKNFVAYSVLAGIFFALQIFAGSILFFLYTALVLGMYFIFNLFTGNFKHKLLKSILVVFLISVTALSLSSIKLLPVLEFTKMSSRSGGVSLEEYLGEPVNIKSFTSLMVRNTASLPISGAIGFAGFLLLIFGFANYRKKIVIFCIIAMAFSILFASGTFVASLMYKVPGFQSMRHVERSLVIVVFAASVLAGYGFAWVNGKIKKEIHKNLFFGFCILFLLVELLFLANFPKSAPVVKTEDMGLLDYMSKDPSYFRTFNVALKDIVGAAGYNHYAQEGISEIKGGGGIWINEYVVFLSAVQQSLSPNVMGLLNVKYIISDTKLEAGNLSYVGSFNECRDCGVWNAFGPYLYKNNLFLPRYYFADKSVLVLGDKNMARQLIFTLDLSNKGNVVFIEGSNVNDYDSDFLRKFDYLVLLKDSIDQNGIGKLNDYVSKGGRIFPDIINGGNELSVDELNKEFNEKESNFEPAEVKIMDYSNNKVVLELNGQKGWLVASERFAHFPGWKAKINSNELGLFKADNVITALYIEGDKGTLSFEYIPSSARIGRLISLVSLFVVLVYFGYLAFKKFKGGSDKA